MCAVKQIRKVFIEQRHTAEYACLFQQAGLEVVSIKAESDAVIAFGGDGTILGMMDSLVGSDIPVLGVNAGHIGFLADCELSALSDSINCLISGDYAVDNLPVLETTGPGGRKVRALNEICINRSAEGGILHISVLVDSREIAVIASDGVLVSTPSGSTAYSLSCGGPILHPNLPVVIVNAICPHLLAIRPIVMPISSRIEFKVLRSRGKKPFIIADGTAKCGAMSEGDTITITASSLTCQVIRTGRRSDYYAMLGKKLGWGYRG